MTDKTLTDQKIATIEYANLTKAPITLTAGKYHIEFQKCENGLKYDSAILLREEGIAPVADFPVNLVQEHAKMGMQFEFTLK